MPTITKLTIKDAPDTNDLEGWTVVEGSPSMKTWGVHTNAEGTMLSGVWEATPGTYHAVYSAYEFVHMIADFKGTWKIEEAVRKHFDFKLD